MENFPTWLDEQLNARGWSHREAAKRGGISGAALDQVISGQTRPGLKLCRGLAKAFGITTEEVMQRAGLLPLTGEVLPQVRDWSDRLRTLTPERREEVVAAMELVLRLGES